MVNETCDIGLNDVYWIMCVMQRKNLKKLQKIVWNLSGKECKIFMEMLQREELGGSKGDQYEVFL
jgi:hypothetical protein